MHDVTRILSEIERGDAGAPERLLPLVYEELRKLAASKLAGEKPGQTLQATALVHEAYLRLVRPLESPPAQGAVHWDSRRHFFAATAEAMRRILIESARRKHRVKRGGHMRRLSIDDVEVECEVPSERLLALDEAIERLKAEDPQKAKLVQLRFFVGLNHEETAHVLGVSAVTVRRHWRYARAWLRRELREGEDADAGTIA